MLTLARRVMDVDINCLRVTVSPTVDMSRDPQDSAVRIFLESIGLIDPDEAIEAYPLQGGVSSDIHMVQTRSGYVVVKRALARLKVEGAWFAPVERSAHEAAFLRVAHELVPDLCPRLIDFDPVTGFIAMQYFDPSDYRLWKTQLLSGIVDPSVAALVGDSLGRLHSAAAAMPALSDEFDTTREFRLLRLDPYFESLKNQHRSIAPHIDELGDMLVRNRRTLVHGDISPKNILVGAECVIFLDAECAWWGDPAFDLAFCINHLVLKAFASPDRSEILGRAASFIRNSYVPHVDWEDPRGLLGRAARLLPALMLARVDGLSPVEYLDRPQKDAVRRLALNFIGRNDVTIDGIVSAQMEEST